MRVRPRAGQRLDVFERRSRCRREPLQRVAMRAAIPAELGQRAAPSDRAPAEAAARRRAAPRRAPRASDRVGPRTSERLVRSSGSPASSRSSAADVGGPRACPPLPPACAMRSAVIGAIDLELHVESRWSRRSSWTRATIGRQRRRRRARSPRAPRPAATCALARRNPSASPRVSVCSIASCGVGAGSSGRSQRGVRDAATRLRSNRCAPAAARSSAIASSSMPASAGRRRRL